MTSKKKQVGPCVTCSMGHHSGGFLCSSTKCACWCVAVGKSPQARGKLVLYPRRTR